MNNTNTNTNTNSNINTNKIVSNENKDFILSLINNLENLGSEKEKDEFIKNYAKLKEQIEKTDNILSLNDDTEPDYNSYNIQELFSILETNSQSISNPEKLETSQLRMLLIVSKILEEKINIETINIIESK